MIFVIKQYLWCWWCYIAVFIFIKLQMGHFVVFSPLQLYMLQELIILRINSIETILYLLYSSLAYWDRVG